MKQTKLTLTLCVLATTLAAATAMHHTPAGAAHASILRPTMPPLYTPTPAPPWQAPGAHIVLNAPEAAGLRAVVQWQGSDGRWYDVDGWRSERADAPITWWVSPADFGKGPFRWVAYRMNSATPASASAPFMLPVAVRDELTVTLRAQP